MFVFCFLIGTCGPFYDRRKPFGDYIFVLITSKIKAITYHRLIDVASTNFIELQKHNLRWYMHSPADVQWPRDKVDGRWSICSNYLRQLSQGFIRSNSKTLSQIVSYPTLIVISKTNSFCEFKEANKQ